MSTPSPMTVPPWMAMVQAHADRAEADPRRRGVENPARDIAQAAHHHVIGERHRPATHRKEPQA